MNPQRRLGSSDLQVSVVGLGCNNFGGKLDLAESRAVIDQAFDSGITLFDTADVYGNRGGSETILGEVLGARRKNIVLATKFGLPMDESGVLPGASPRYIRSAVEASLKRLKTDWIDLYQLHRPDPNTPIDDTLHALDELVRSGKVRAIGCSFLGSWQVVDADWTARTRGLSRFVCAQDEYSLLRRGIEAELLPALQHVGAGLLPFFPLANGLLTGKYRPGEPPPAGSRLALPNKRKDLYLTETNLRLAAQLQDFARDRGRTLLQLAFSWLASRPCVSSVIAGATTAEQVRQNVAAAGWVLSAEECAEVDRITLGA